MAYLEISDWISSTESLDLSQSFVPIHQNQSKKLPEVEKKPYKSNGTSIMLPKEHYPQTTTPTPYELTEIYVQSSKTTSMPLTEFQRAISWSLVPKIITDIPVHTSRVWIEWSAEQTTGPSEFFSSPSAFTSF